MSKDEMVEILKEHGYPAENVDGVVYVRKALSKKEVRDVQRILRKAGYNQSYGYRRQAEEAGKKT